MIHQFAANEGEVRLVTLYRVFDLEAANPNPVHVECVDRSANGQLVDLRLAEGSVDVRAGTCRVVVGARRCDGQAGALSHSRAAHVDSRPGGRVDGIKMAVASGGEQRVALRIDGEVRNAWLGRRGGHDDRADLLQHRARSRVETDQEGIPGGVVLLRAVQGPRRIEIETGEAARVGEFVEDFQAAVHEPRDPTVGPFAERTEAVATHEHRRIADAVGRSQIEVDDYTDVVRAVGELNGIDAVAAVEGVVAVPAEQKVVAGAAGKRIVTVIAEQNVIATATDQCVGGGGPES